MEIIIRDEEKIYSFSKWEGMSICYHEDNDPFMDQVHEDEEYILDEEYYNGDKSIIDYLSNCNKSTFYTVHNYRFLEYGANTYDAGETYTTLYYVDSEGCVVMC